MAEKVEGPKNVMQILAATAANLASLAGGTGYGWSSPVGLMLSSNNTDATPIGRTISVASEEFAWISSLLIVGCLIGPLIASFLADRIGRKWTLQISGFLFIIASIMFILGYNVWILYVARIIQGTGIGFIFTTLPLYIGEIADDKLRGPLGSLMPIFLSAGTLAVYAIGAYTSYYILQYSCLVIPVAFISLFFFMPESPFYLMMIGKKDRATKSLQFLRQQPADQLQDELNLIKSLTEKSEGEQGSFMLIIKNKGNLKAFFICWGLITFQQLNGMHAVLLNTQIILDQANTGIDTGITSIIIAFLQVVAGMITPLIANRFGRKTILLVSQGFVVVGLVGLGVFFYLAEKQPDIVPSIIWLPIISLAVYMVLLSVGIVPIPFTIIGEIFSNEVKFLASATLSVNGAIISFVIARWYPALQTFGIYFPFWLYAGLSAIGIIFIVLVVIETKGLSLKEIQDKLIA